MKRLLLVVVGGSALVARRPTTMRAMQPEARALRTRIKTQTKIKRTLVTLGRVALPSMIATGLGFEYYDNLSSFIQANWLDANSIKFLSSDEIQFLPSFLTVISLLFSILAGSALLVLVRPAGGHLFRAVQVLPRRSPCWSRWRWSAPAGPL